jgi:hypothetical protein
MNKVQDYIIDQLNYLYNSIDGIKIRYEYRDYIHTHIIEVLPINIFELNQKYISLEMEIQDQFEELYGEKEEILFISSESLNEIHDVHFCLGYPEFRNIEPSNLIDRIFYFPEFGNKITADNTSYALAA